MTKLMEQVAAWLKSDEREVTIKLTLCKTGISDTFKVKYDADKAWALTLMLESDGRLCEAARSAMLKHFAEMDDSERDEAIRELAALCRKIHGHMHAVLSKERSGGRNKIYS